MNIVIPQGIMISGKLVIRAPKVADSAKGQSQTKTSSAIEDRAAP